MARIAETLNTKNQSTIRPFTADPRQNPPCRLTRH
jgi:hypothetical protein